MAAERFDPERYDDEDRVRMAPDRDGEYVKYEDYQSC
jgi:hypothetical protein